MECGNSALLAEMKRRGCGRGDDTQEAVCREPDGEAF